MNKDARELLRFAESNGFKCVRSHKHIVLVHGADTSVRVTMSSTPSDRKNWVRLFGPCYEERCVRWNTDTVCTPADIKSLQKG